MATPSLPPVIASPFGNAFVRKPRLLSSTSKTGPDEGDDYHYHYKSYSPRTLRAVSVPISPPESVKYTSPNENKRHSFSLGGSSGSPIRRAYSMNAAHHGRPQSTYNTLKSGEEAPGNTETFPISEDPRESLEDGFDDMQYYHDAGRSSDQSWTWAQNESAYSAMVVGKVHPDDATAVLLPSKHEEAAKSPTSRTALERSLGRTATNFKRWAGTFRHKRGQHRPKVDSQNETSERPTNLATTFSPLPLRYSWHHKRTSNASSRFVATVQTASLSNESTSVVPQSRGGRLSDARVNRSSDTRANQSSDPRSSLDSQKPSSVCSADEGALQRALKRRHILQEILSSEESYVADLKALHNLFATLLTSIPTISAQIRNSIQRNVMEMLHLHEQIVDELHRASLRAASRESKQITSPLGRGMRRHRKWQSLDARSFRSSAPMCSLTEMERDNEDLRSHSNSILRADAVAAADFARVYQHHMARMFMYEEYSCKYDIMVQELAHSHKTVPQWSSYDVGMEALANSIASIDQRGKTNRKGLTAADLLIKPIQRVSKYPLMFENLYKQTSVADCPASHVEVDATLKNFREVAREINLATDDPKVREKIQRRWLLQERLKLGSDTMEATQFRMLGHVLLCGVLHVAYQTNNRIEGGYMLCMLFKDYLIVAVPAARNTKFEIAATIYLADAKVVSTEDGRGLQCHTALFSWKIVFESDSHLFELILSACSITEQQQWLAGIERGRSLLALETPPMHLSSLDVSTRISLGLKALIPVFDQAGTLARRLSIQRAATVSPRIATCQVIIRNTHRPQEGLEVKPSTFTAIHRSQSLLTTHRVTVLAPKRSERIRLEQSLSNVWTRDTLPFPGMSLSRSGNIIRVSAGSLVRKLSLASMQTPFAKRSTSLTLIGSRFSHDTSTELKHEPDQPHHHPLVPRDDEPLYHEIILDDPDESSLDAQMKPDEGAEIVIPHLPPPLASRRLSLPTADKKLKRRSLITNQKRNKNYNNKKTMNEARSMSRAGKEGGGVGTLDAECDLESTVADKLLTGCAKKRWSHPLGLLKTLSTEGVRHLLYSSK